MEETIKTWLMEVSGYSDQHVIQEQENGCRPSTAFITFNVSTLRTDDDAVMSKGEIDENYIDIHYDRQRHYLIDVSVYALDGKEIHAELKASGVKWSIRTILSEARLSLITGSEAIKVPTVGDTAWRHHYVSTYTFRGFQRTTERIDRINRIVLGGTMDGVPREPNIEVAR